ncbi:MAG TPA: gas vesicle protein GvpG [Vicinamibacteria bacterium]|jgi:hypothetical protein|nr:gas vesicle protein GvpG [Vicinamibacteria bacterium]
MIILDSLLVGGLRFVLDKLAAAVDSEMNDDRALREELVANQMRLELGEISEEEFAQRERDLLARIREIRERRRGEAPAPAGGGRYTVESVETTFDEDEKGR